MDCQAQNSKEISHSLVDSLVLRMACESSMTRWFPDAEVTRRTRSWQSTVWLHRRCQGHPCRLLRHRPGEVLAGWIQFPWQSMHFYHRHRPLSRTQHTRTSSCRRERRQSLRHCREGRDRSTHGAVGTFEQYRKHHARGGVMNMVWLVRESEQTMTKQHTFPRRCTHIRQQCTARLFIGATSPKSNR